MPTLDVARSDGRGERRDRGRVVVVERRLRAAVNIPRGEKGILGRSEEKEEDRGREGWREGYRDKDEGILKEEEEEEEEKKKERTWKKPLKRAESSLGWRESVTADQRAV